MKMVPLVISAILVVLTVFGGVALANINNTESNKVSEQKLMHELENTNNTEDLERVTDKYKSKQNNRDVQEALDYLSDLSSVETREIKVDVDLNDRNIKLQSPVFTEKTENNIKTAMCAIGLDSEESPISIVFNQSENSVLVDLNGDVKTEIKGTSPSDRNSEIGRLPVQNKVSYCT